MFCSLLCLHFPTSVPFKFSTRFPSIFLDFPRAEKKFRRKKCRLILLSVSSGFSVARSLIFIYLPTKRTTIVDFPLYRRLPETQNPSSDEILNGFLGYVEEKSLVPYNTQEEAILELL